MVLPPLQFTGQKNDNHLMEEVLAGVPTLHGVIPLSSLGHLARTRLWGDVTRDLVQQQRQFLRRKLMPTLKTVMSLMRLFPQKTAQWGRMMAKGHFLFFDDLSARSKPTIPDDGVWCLPLDVETLAREETEEGRLQVLWNMVRGQGLARVGVYTRWPNFEHWRLPDGLGRRGCGTPRLIEMRAVMKQSVYLVHLHGIITEMEETWRRPSTRDAMESYSCVHYLYNDKFLQNVEGGTSGGVKFLYHHYIPRLIRSLFAARGGKVEDAIKNAICKQIFRVVNTRYLVRYDKPSLESIWRQAKAAAAVST